MTGKSAFGAACLLACAMPAQAQSSLTIYGILDAGLTYIDDQAGHSSFQFAEGINYGNRFGLRGQEDLGGGYATVFNLENGFSLGTGNLRQGGRLFGRQAFVGMRTPAGTLTMGRQYDFMRDYVQQFNVGGYASVYAGHQGDFDRISGKQLDRSVKYASPNLSGLSFGAMYSFGPEFESSRGNAWSLGAGYKSGPLSVGAMYTRLNDVAVFPYLTSGLYSFLGQPSAVADPASGETIDLFPAGYQVEYQGIAGLGASWRFANGVAIMANTTAITFDDGRTSSTQRIYEAGVVFPLAPALTGIAAYQYAKFEGTHWNQPTVGVRYDLSKRTWLYASASFLKASGGTDASQGAGFYTIPAYGDTQTTMRVAMVHTF